MSFRLLRFPLLFELLPMGSVLMLYGLSGIFIYAGIAKIVFVEGFFEDVSTYGTLGSSFSWMVALYLPWLELASAVGLLWPRLRGGALLIVGGLLLIFLASLVFAWARGLDIRCGCFGSGAEPAHYGGPQSSTKPRGN